MSDRELWVVNLHMMSTGEKRVAWCGDRTENTWKRHLTLRHRGRWWTFKRGRGAGLIWENLGGGMKGTHQSQWITIRNQVLMAELWRRCQWTGVEAFFFSAKWSEARGMDEGRKLLWGEERGKWGREHYIFLWSKRLRKKGMGYLKIRKG